PAGMALIAQRALLKRGKVYLEVEQEGRGPRLCPLRVPRDAKVLGRAWPDRHTNHVLIGVPDILEQIVWPGDDVYEVAASLVRTRFEIPCLKEWVPLMERAGLLKRLPVLGNAGFNVVTVEEPGGNGTLLDWIAHSLKAGVISIPGATPGDGQIERVGGLEEYLQTFAQDLAKKVVSLYKPLHSSRERDDPAVGEILRKPYPAQGVVAQGAAKALGQRRGVFLVGEMGTGKTLISLLAAHLYLRDGYRVLVLCPAHLTKKWVREIRNTVPGADAVVIDNWKEALKQFKVEPPRGRKYYVVSKETAKLGYALKPAAVWRARGKVWTCPDCGGVLGRKTRCGSLVPFKKEAFNSHTKLNSFCVHCGATLWAADRRTRKVAVVDIVKKRVPKGYFDLLIADELHEYKGRTAQGLAFSTLVSKAKRFLALTGTLAGGYASSLFYLLFALAPHRMKAMGFEYEDLAAFVREYGTLEKITTVEESYNKASRGQKQSVRLKELPGISLKVFTRHLFDSAAFIDLDDIAEALPEYREEVRLVEMEPEQKRAYEELVKKLKKAARAAVSKKKARLLGQYVTGALAYPDRPYDNEDIVDHETGAVTARPRDLPQDRLYPKEEALVNLVKEEVDKGRRVLVYVRYTAKKDVTERLRELLENAGFRAKVLKATVPPEEREEWLKRAVSDGVRVVIANMELVKTGLDLYDFPTLVFYQTGYNLYTLRQAARRSWRIGQTQPVRVVFMAYRDSLQDAALRLMGGKLKAALALEGKFSEDGLRALAQGGDTAAQLAKALIDGFADLDSAESLWRSPQAGRIAAGRDVLVPHAAPAYVELLYVPGGGRRKRKLPQGISQLAWDFGESAAKMKSA
ncbi:MAG: helicase-related protein, partial [Anaerolineae bacterium]